MINDALIIESLPLVYQRLAKGGVFLTVKNGADVNTMTIGWGGITIFWGKPVFIVPVRESRYTFNIINSAKEFTVSVPVNVNLAKELAYCGTRSGRDGNKFTATGLTLTPGHIIDTPVITQCELHFECKIVYHQTMDPEYLDSQIKDRFYPDYHTMYYGEIVACYRTDR